MRIGYVSDERFLALADVLVELERDGETAAVIRSSPRGALDAQIMPGEYRITLAKEGFGPKSVTARLDGKTPYQIRLLSNALCGYAWPKWVTSGERSEFRVHCAEPYRLSLWRYGL